MTTLTAANRFVSGKNLGYVIIETDTSNTPNSMQNSFSDMESVFFQNYRISKLSQANKSLVGEFDTSLLSANLDNNFCKNSVYEIVFKKIEEISYQNLFERIKLYDNPDGEFDGMDLISSYIDDILTSSDSKSLNSFIISFLMQDYSYQFHIHLLMLIKHKNIDTEIKNALINSARQAGQRLGRDNFESVIDFAK